MSIHWLNKVGFLICFLEHSYLKHTPRSQSDHVARAQRGSLSGYSHPGSIKTTPISLRSFWIHWLNRYKQVGRGMPLSTLAYVMIYHIAGNSCGKYSCQYAEINILYYGITETIVGVNFSFFPNAKSTTKNNHNTSYISE